MKKQSLFLCIFVSFVVFIIIYMYFTSSEYDLKCIVSSKDGNRYCVREREKIHLATNLLADVSKNLNDMVDYLKAKHPSDPRTKRLIENFSATKICETLPTSELTAYTENKGEKIAFCLNKKKHNDSVLIDIHTLTFVALHELAHVATVSTDHKQEFWDNFKWILENAKEAKIYTPVDYKNNPKQYCGMTINDNPYYDLI